MPIWTGAVNNNWSNAGNWLADGTGVGVPTATSDAVFSSTSAVNCTVDVVGGAVCRNLNFNGGTGYAGTITMSNSITVGATTSATPNQSVTLSASMGINPAGTAAIITRSNGTTTLTSNGRSWPNNLAINNVQVAGVTSGTVTVADNWTVGSLTLGPAANHSLTVQGAFTITVNGNFLVAMTGGTSSRVVGVTGSLTTIRLAGTGTWSTGVTFAAAASSAVGFGINININAPGQTVTISNNCYFGGSASVTGGATTFSYTAGTVVHSGTFYLLGNQAGNGYSVNISGNPSTSATTTSTTGVNFQNLTFITFSAGQSPGACAITGNICVVGNLTTTNFNFATTRYPILTSGGTIYVNGNFTNNAGVRDPSTTIVRLQGTSAIWTEATIPSQSNYGTSWQVQINTTGTVSVTSNIALTWGGSLTYTAGTFTWGTGNILYMAFSAALYGIGSYGIQIDSLIHPTGSGGGTINFYDTVPVKFGAITLTGTSGTLSWFHYGTIGWISNTFTCQLNAGSTNPDIKFLNNIEYKVNSSLVLTAYSTSNTFRVQSQNNGSTIFTLAFGAAQDVYYASGGSGLTLVDSSAGQTIWTRGGSIATGTKNWNQWDFPKTRFSTFTN